MNELFWSLLSSLGSQAIEKVASSVGTDSSTAKNAIDAALPFLLGWLKKNSWSGEGVAGIMSALTKHDGSALGDVVWLLSWDKLSDGMGILKHVLSNSAESSAQKAVAAKTGLDAWQTMKLLSFLAPLVMNFLWKKKKESNLDAQWLTSLIASTTESSVENAPWENSLLKNLLDQDGDGSATDDLLRMGGGLLKGMLG